MTERLGALLPRYAPLFLLALAWEGLTLSGIVPSAALPRLDTVATAWFGLAESGELWTNAVASISRGASGLGLAIACGSLIGVLMAWYKPVRIAVNPIVQFFYPMPKSALIPVMVLWLGFGDASKVVLIFVGCLLPVTLSAFNGARGTDEFLIWSARSMGASRARVLWEVVLPSALPELLSGVRTALARSAPSSCCCSPGKPPPAPASSRRSCCRRCRSCSSASGRTSLAASWRSISA